MEIGTASLDQMQIKTPTIFSLLSVVTKFLQVPPIIRIMILEENWDNLMGWVILILKNIFII